MIEPPEIAMIGSVELSAPARRIVSSLSISGMKISVMSRSGTSLAICAIVGRHRDVR